MVKKVVCVHLLNDYSGSPNVLLNTTKALNNSLIDVDLLTNQYGSGFLDGSPVNKKTILYKWFSNKLLTLLFYIISQIHVFFKIIFLYKSNSKDVIIFVNTIMPFGAALAGKIIGSKVIYHVHEASIKPKLLNNFLKFIQCSTADLSLYVSNYLMKEECCANGSSEQVYNSLSPEFISRVNKVESPLDEYGNFNVLMACSLKEYKGVYEFIRISEILSKHSNIRFTLILNAAGKDIDEFVANNNKISDNVTVLGSQSSMNSFYQSTSLLMNLSIVDQCVETFGMTLLEAMSYGLPCIAPPEGGPTELVEHEVNGYLVDSRENERVAAYIETLAQDEVRWKSMSNYAYRKAAKFNFEEFSKSIVEMVNNV